MTPPIYLSITPGDDAPIYRQLVRQVIDGVAAGALAPGEQLPSLRALAQKLVVAPLTVKKAYDVLEADGVVESRRGQGTFIREDAVRSSTGALERLRPLARRLAAEADVAGVDAALLAELIEQETRALQQERAQGGERR